MINQQLAVVHAVEDLDVRLGTEREQVFRLRFANTRDNIFPPNDSP